MTNFLHKTAVFARKTAVFLHFVKNKASESKNNRQAAVQSTDTDIVNEVVKAYYSYGYGYGVEEEKSHEYTAQS